MNALSLSTSLNDLDWEIVKIARSDGPRSINPDGLRARLARALFGLPVARRLASEKLEALRQFCVRAWYWDLIRTTDLRKLIDAGYSSAAVFQVLAHVASYRGFTPAIQEQPI